MLKTHNEHCKAPGSVKVSKSSTFHHGSKRGVENQDPSAPERGAITANKLKGVSRLPVLVKSLQLPATTDPTQMKWQERPLLGKEKRKKACTKPQPFNLSQPRVSRLGTLKQEPASLGNTGTLRTLPTTRPARPRPAKTQSTLHPKPKTGTAVPVRTKPAEPGTFCGASKNIGSLPAQTSNPLNGATVDQCHNVLSRLGHGGSTTKKQTFHGEPDSLPTLRCAVPESHATDKTATLLDVFKDISTHLSGISLASSKHAASALDDGLSEACGHNTPFRTPRSHAAPQRVAVKTKSQTAHPTPGFCKPGNTTDGFCPDPSALRSILQSEGVSASGLQGTAPRPSFCPSGRATSVYLPQRVSVLKSAQRKKAESNTGKAQTFLPDPAALGSILRNEGVQPGGHLGGATPSGRATSIYTAQRVPVSKSRTEGGSGAPEISVTFSPDPAALSSILRNEGIQAGGATPHASACPSARGTSIYTAQRVPVTKSRAEIIAASLGPVRSSPSLTPAVKWTPLRVPNTKPQSTKRLLSVYRTPKFSGSPGLRGVQPPSAELPAHKEDDVVQTLFKEQEEEEKMEDDDEEPQTVPELEAEAKPLVTEEAEMAGPQQAEETGSRGPFLQAVHRESVIMLCSGQNLFRQTPARGTTPATDTQAPSSTTKPHCPSTRPVGTLPGPLQQPSGSKVTTNLESTVPTKVTSLCRKRALELRRRLPALEELFLDEECATYMSQPQYCAALPRCSNPVANRLLFQDSTCFLPIGQLTSPSPTSCAV
ncbi:tastin isoform X2 [Clupea harengus]|uniref:Tastin isoform X2 n=1 Tax=Clupea harengus TaxID=7950 RepID=A0A6P8FCZ0_CLUHA|nr:tastin isoform X2 [Clupea harengus]